MTAIDATTHVHTLLNAEFAPRSEMKGEFRVGVQGGSGRVGTERVESVVDDPVVVWGNRLGIESRAEGVEGHHHLNSVVGAERHG